MLQNKPLDRERKLVICITGPTATGKTETAVALCKALHGEVISMDSMQIFACLQIGTAKPTENEMQGIPHHMLSIIPPDAGFTVYAYQQQAMQVMHQLLNIGKLPVFCGGTGLYLQAVTHPLAFTGAGATGDIRKKLEEDAEKPDGPQMLMRRLSQVDPVTAERLHVNNTRRVIRALEVYECTGIPMSAQVQDWDLEPEQDFMIFALCWPRDMLYQRIELRVDRMLEAGLIEEVETLMQNGLVRESQAMQAIGYKEIYAMISGECTKEEAIETIKRNSRRYAKRQLTWLRRVPNIRWLDISQYSNTTSVADAMIGQIDVHKKETHAEY